jgi:hypothetical protein
MRKFTYSRTLNTPEGLETFSAVEHDSFLEGQRAVDAGIHDRKIQILNKYPDYTFEGYNNGHGSTFSTPTPGVSSTPIRT